MLVRPSARAIAAIATPIGRIWNGIPTGGPASSPFTTGIVQPGPGPIGIVTCACGGSGGGGGGDPVAGPAASVFLNSLLNLNGNNLLPAASRVLCPFDSIIYASPGMVNLAQSPPPLFGTAGKTTDRITIIQAGLYAISFTATYDPTRGGGANATEFGWNICKNGLPNVTQGLPGPAGQFQAVFNPVNIAGEGLFQTVTNTIVGVPLQVGEFISGELQSDQTFQLFVQNDPFYFRYSPQLSVVYQQPIPS